MTQKKGQDIKAEARKHLPEWVKTHKAYMKKNNLVYDPKTNDLIIVDRVPAKAKTK